MDKAPFHTRFESSDSSEASSVSVLFISIVLQRACSPARSPSDSAHLSHQCHLTTQGRLQFLDAKDTFPVGKVLSPCNSDIDTQTVGRRHVSVSSATHKNKCDNFASKHHINLKPQRAEIQRRCLRFFIIHCSTFAAQQKIIIIHRRTPGTSAHLQFCFRSTDQTRSPSDRNTLLRYSRRRPACDYTASAHPITPAKHQGSVSRHLHLPDSVSFRV